MKSMIAVGAALIALTAAGCTKGSDSAVIAKVNNGTITAADFKKQLEDLQPQMLQAVAGDEKARKEFLEDLIGIELVLQEARRQGLDKDPEFKKKQESMRREMEQRIQDAAKNELFNTVLKKELMEKVKEPTDVEVKAYYDEHRAEIKKAAGGKDLTLKQAEAQGLKRYVMQMKQRDAYLEYAKALKAKAKVSVDDKALEALAKDLAKPAQSTLQLNPPVVMDGKKAEETKK
ncbi:MAG: SurA N-terminal domain-containing protein [Nitrospirota bacterium]